MAGSTVSIMIYPYVDIFRDNPNKGRKQMMPYIGRCPYTSNNDETNKTFTPTPLCITQIITQIPSTPNKGEKHQTPYIVTDFEILLIMLGSKTESL